MTKPIKPKGETKVRLVDESSFACATPADAQAFNKKLIYWLRHYETVVIDCRNVQVLTPNFIQVAFVEIEGMPAEIAEKRLKFHNAKDFIYLIKKEFSRGKQRDQDEDKRQPSGPSESM